MIDVNFYLTVCGFKFIFCHLYCSIIFYVVVGVPLYIFGHCEFLCIYFSFHFVTCAAKFEMCFN